MSGYVCRRDRHAADRRPRAAARSAFLISADLFVCGVVSIIQSFGATQWFGVRLPATMGVTFAAVGPMVMANANPGADGARMIVGAIRTCDVRHGRATGIRILAAVEFRTNRNNLFVVAVSLGFGIIPLIASASLRFLRIVAICASGKKASNALPTPDA